MQPSEKYTHTYDSDLFTASVNILAHVIADEYDEKGLAQVFLDYIAYQAECDDPCSFKEYCMDGVDNTLNSTGVQPIK